MESSMGRSKQSATRPILVGIGGVSCSGKSTVTDRLAKVLPVHVIYQDKFFKKSDHIPLIDGVQDWDSPDSMDMEAFAARLREVHKGGSAKASTRNEPGYNDPSPPTDISLKTIFQQLDIKVFVTAQYGTLEARRAARTGYMTSGGTWKDPPGYFRDVVWPAYLRYNNKVLRAVAGEKVEGLDGLVVVDTDAKSVEECVCVVAEAIFKMMSQRKDVCR
ncbi:P-loop containing nucleoside triphosphate hydrolase protein [Powellomyces hirtus]|nr:P-loop containing nucleoside triphosphate hydrolase protein [Powellomyces hirtus]